MKNYNRKYRTEFWREISEFHYQKIEQLKQEMRENLNSLSNIALGGLIHEAYLMKYDKNCSRHVRELEASENIAQIASDIIFERGLWFSSVKQTLEYRNGELIHQYKKI